MELTMNTEVLVEIFLAENVDESSVDELRLEGGAVLRQSKTVQPVVCHPEVVDF